MGELSFTMQQLITLSNMLCSLQISPRRSRGLLDSCNYHHVGIVIYHQSATVADSCIASRYTMFYKKSEQPLRNTITFGAYSSVINGLIGFAIGFIPAGSGSLLSWRWLFIVLGGVTVIWGIFVFFYLPDNPGNAKWLTPREKAMVVRRVSENQTGIQNKQWKWYQLRECLLDYRSWLLFFYIIGVTIPNGGLNT